MNIGKVLLSLGALIYVGYSVVNRFFYKIPDMIAFIIMGIGLLFILVGIFYSGK